MLPIMKCMGPEDLLTEFVHCFVDFYCDDASTVSNAESIELVDFFKWSHEYLELLVCGVIREELVIERHKIRPFCDRTAAFPYEKHTNSAVFLPLWSTCLSCPPKSCWNRPQMLQSGQSINSNDVLTLA